MRHDMQWCAAALLYILASSFVVAMVRDSGVFAVDIQTSARWAQLNAVTAAAGIHAQLARPAAPVQLDSIHQPTITKVVYDQERCVFN